MPSTLDPARAARVNRLDRSVVCGKALASARRMARQFGGRFADYLSHTMSVAWAEQRRHIQARVEMTARVLAVAEELKAEGRAYRAEVAASVCRVMDERARAAGPVALKRAA